MVSVIIPSYNSQNTIRACLNSLLSQLYREEYEIIVVDSSNDGTPDIIKKEFPQVLLLHLPQKTQPGRARNLGVKKSRGELILFIDSDCIASPDWIQRMVHRHRQFPDVAAVGGAVEIGNEISNSIAVAGYMSEFREFLPTLKSGFVKHIPTLNVSYKKAIWEENGGFDDQLYPQEDLVFNYQLINKGFQIFFDPEIRVKHFHRENLREFLDHQKNIGCITARVLKRLPLPGHFLFANMPLFLCTGYLLPCIKFIRTLFVFIRHLPMLLLRSPGAIVIFKLGLIPWVMGLYRGAIKENCQR